MNEFISTIKELSILIVDDSKSSSMLIKHQLNRLGVLIDKVMVCNNHRSALSIIENKKFDLLFIDYHLDQGFTGNELRWLMEKNKLIGEDTAIILISSDSSTETIFTIISSNVRYFIKKPISNCVLKKNLGRYIEDTRSWYKIKKVLSGQVEDNQARRIQKIIESGSSHGIEAKLISFLIDKKNYPLLTTYLSMSKTAEHVVKICAKSHILKALKKNSDAISLLTEHIRNNPLSLQAIDELVDLFILEEQFSDAYPYAEKAFRVTPIVGARLISVSFLAMRLGKTNELMEFGLIHVRRFSPIDPEWEINISKYLDCIKCSLLEYDLDVFLNFIVRFFSIAEKKIKNSNLGKKLTAIKEITIAEYLYERNDLAKSHNRLLKYLSCCNYELSYLPTFTIGKIISLADTFYETWISKIMLNELSNRLELNKKDIYIKDIINKKSACGTRESLSNQIEEIRSNHPKKTINALSELFVKYRFNTEIKLFVHRANILLDLEVQSSDMDSINIECLPLQWQLWLKDLHQTGAIVTLPAL